MTLNQKNVYSFMLKFKKKHGYSPGMLTIGNHLQMTKGSIRQVFTALEEKGLIVKKTNVQEGQYDAVDK